VKKNIYLAWLLSGKSLNEAIDSHELILKKLAQEFGKLYIINFVHLKLFSDLATKKDKFNSKLNKNIKIPKNVEIFCPRTSNDFKKFMLNKKLIGILNLGRNLSDLRINLILSKYNIVQIQISNIGFFNSPIIITRDDLIKNFIRLFFYFLNKKIGQKVTLLLCNLKLLSKVDIRFISDLRIINHTKKNFFRKILFKLKLPYAKEFILVNSRTFDIFKNNNYKSSKKKIILLDAMINHPEQVVIRGEWNKREVDTHYNNLKSFLKKISKLYNKKVCVCIHPKDDIKKKRKIFKDFEVVQFETKRNVYEAFIVLFFDTSAIIDAILLKKNIINLVSKNIPKTFDDLGKSFSEKAGILRINIEDNFEITSNKLLIKLKKRKLNYNKYIKNYIVPDGNIPGWKKITDILKKRYFGK